MTIAWYALRSKPNKEDFLWKQVLNRQMEVFYPAVRTKPANPRARRTRPYFPGYLFVQADLEKTPLSIWRWLPGGRGLVTFDEEPAAVPESLISAIRSRVDEINTIALEEGKPPAELKTGERVCICSGPFANSDAIFDGRLSGSDRVRVLLQYLKDRMVPLELPAGHVERKNRPAFRPR